MKVKIMPEEQWTAVDEYLAELFVPEDPILTDALRESERAGLDPIAVSPLQGKLLHLLVQLTGARRILEIGTLGAYSSLWMARALPEDGKIISLELREEHANVARTNIDRAGFSDRVEVRVGAAMDSLQAMHSMGEAAFDFIFVDADKASIPRYYEAAMKLSRRGTVMVIDNVIRNGAVLDADSSDPDIQGVRTFNAMVASDPRITTTTLQTVGSKGYDGFAILLVTGD